METKVITTKCGDCVGEVREDAVLYQGIPYATADRFEYPVPVTDFKGCFDATKKPIEFPQFNTFEDDSQRFYTKEFRKGETFEYGENILTLTVITPKEAENCPVLIYIHGGGFYTGKLSEFPHGTSQEYAKRGIILVSVGYRLNVFGLYDTENYYLYDQLTAIRWVRDNIEAFGGNGSDITLIGQSAGAMSIFQLLYTDALKGIVKGAVMMSGAGFFPNFGRGYTREEAKWFWNLVTKNAGCGSREELKDVSTETLWRSWFNTRKDNFKLRLDMPGVDGVMIPAQQSEIRKSGKMLDIPLMVGITNQDMMVPIIIFDMAVGFALWSWRRGREPVYLYYFDHALPGNLYKAYHASDLWYVFGNMDKCWRPWTVKDYELRDTMIDAVVQFVRTGNPGWAPFTPRNLKLRRFSTEGREFITPAECYPALMVNSTVQRGPF